MKIDRRKALQIIGTSTSMLVSPSLAGAASAKQSIRQLAAIKNQKQLSIEGLNPNQSIHVITAPGVPHITVDSAFRLGLKDYGHSLLSNYLRIKGPLENFSKMLFSGYKIPHFFDQGHSIGLKLERSFSWRFSDQEFQFRLNLLKKYEDKKFVISDRVEYLNGSRIKELKKLGFQVVVVDLVDMESSILNYKAFQNPKLVRAKGRKKVDLGEVSYSDDLLFRFKRARDKFERASGKFADFHVVMDSRNAMQDLIGVLSSASISLDKNQLQSEKLSPQITGSLKI